MSADRLCGGVLSTLSRYFYEFPSYLLSIFYYSPVCFSFLSHKFRLLAYCNAPRCMFLQIVCTRRTIDFWCRRLGCYCSQNEPSLTQLMDDADERLFRRIMNNSEHVLQPFLPDRPDLSCNLRRRPHCNKSLITKTVDLSNNDYIIRATYKDSYWHYS